MTDSLYFLFSRDYWPNNQLNSAIYLTQVEKIENNYQNFTLQDIGQPFGSPKPTVIVAVEISSYSPLTPKSSTFGFIYPALSNKKEQLFNISGTESANLFIKSRGSIGVWRSGVRPCSDLWDHPRPLDQASMSQRPVTSHDESNPANDGRSITLPPVNIRTQGESLQDSRHEGSSGDAAPSQSSDQSAQRTPASYQPTQSADDRPAPSASRSLGVHNILNPTEPEDVRPSPSFPAVASPAVGAAESARDETTSTSRPSTRAKRAFRSSSISSSEGADHSRPRKTLFPKSPRSMSLGGSGTGVFLQSTKQQAGPDAATGYTATPGAYAGAAIPPIPSLPPQPQYGYNFLPPVSIPPIDRRRSAGTTGPSGLSKSQKTSPQPSYFAYSAQTSAAQQHLRAQGPLTSGHYQPIESQSMGGLRPSQPAIKQEEGPYMTPTHGSLSMQGSQGLSAGDHGMHLQSGRIPVPLDRVSGSRSADEKRKHNAAASSRFRERRKKLNNELKKENEGYAMETKELKQQLEETRQRLEQVERELNCFRDAYHNNPGASAGGMHQPPPAQPPFHGISYGHPSARIGPRPSDEEERPARRRRTQGPEQGEGYTLPPTTTYPSTSGYPPRADDGRSTQGLQPARNAPGSMGAPSPMPRSPYEQYHPSTNGSGYFHGQRSGPPTPGSSQPVLQPQPQPQPPPSGTERRG